MEFKTADNRLIDSYSGYKTKNMRRPLLKKAGGASHKTGKIIRSEER